MKHLILILSILGFSVAETASQAAPLPPQQQLQKLLGDIKHAQRQKGEQTTAIKQLEQQLACHWALIRSYQTCDRLHVKQPTEQLRCAHQAKTNADNCLSRLGAETDLTDIKTPAASDRD